MQQRRSHPRRHGAAAVEGAVVLGIFMLLLMGLVEYSRFLWVREMCENAAREGARFAIVSQGSSATIDVQNRAWTAMGGQAANTSSGTSFDTTTLANAVGKQLGNHSNSANAFRMDGTTLSDIRVFRSTTSGLPQGINLSTGATTNYTLDTWYQADWTQANFGDSIAVQIVGYYKPISSNILFLPNTISVTFTSIMRCEANQ